MHNKLLIAEPIPKHYRDKADKLLMKNGLLGSHRQGLRHAIAKNLYLYNQAAHLNIAAIIHAVNNKHQKENHAHEKEKIY